MDTKKKLKIAVASGKGGVGKSMLVSSLAILFSNKHQIVAVDCDVDAPNLAIWLNEMGRWSKIKKISTSEKPIIDLKKCIGCGLCVSKCRFNALSLNKGKAKLNTFVCEGCGLCEIVCPQKAIKLKSVKNGAIKTKKTKYGFTLISGQLFPGETGSGKVTTEIIKKASTFASAFTKVTTDKKASADKEKYKHNIMLIDSAPGTGCPVIAALREVDYVILATEPTPSGFSDLKRVMELVYYFKLPYGIIINKWDINKPLSQKIQKWVGKYFLGRISYDQKIFKAISSFTPIMETDLRAKCEIENIFKKLMKL